ncbi:MAG: hypothetical protein Q8930_16625, partial [Bacillota bacterium]|nr:hypothetical protein [Bacillota bacterium]
MIKLEKHDDNSNLWKDYVDNCEDIDCSDIEDLEDLDCEYKHKSHCVKICKIPGPRGPQGEPGASIDCLCVTQIRNILRQMMCLFPKSKILINYENGGSVAGIPVELYTESSNEGVVKLADDSGTITDRINICKIAAITLTGHCDETLYNEDGSI